MENEKPTPDDFAGGCGVRTKSGRGFLEKDVSVESG